MILPARLTECTEHSGLRPECELWGGFARQAQLPPLRGKFMWTTNIH